MYTMDKAYSNSMEKLTSSMEKLTGSISDGFALLQRMMCQPLNNMNLWCHLTIHKCTQEHKHQFKAQRADLTRMDSFQTQALYSDMT